MTLAEHVQRESLRFLTELLAKHRGNVSAAAREAGVGRQYWYRLMAKVDPSNSKRRALIADLRAGHAVGGAP